MYKLEFLNGPTRGHTQTFLKPTVLIGRDDDCDLVLRDGGVSRRHAVIEYTDGQGRVRDLGALNPVTVNGVVVRDALLEHGDELGVGTVQLRYHQAHIPQPVTYRKRSPLEALVILGLLVLAFAQAFFLATTAREWRAHIQPDLLRPTATPLPTPEPIPIPTLDPSLPTPVPSATPLPTATAIPTPTPEPTPLPLPTPTPLPGLENASPEELIALAKEQTRQGQLMNADRLLAQAEHLRPENLEVLSERARLFGRRAMYPESIEHWRKVLALTAPGSAEHTEAESETAVMRRRQGLLTGDFVPEATPVPAPTRRMPTPSVPTPTRLPQATRQEPAGVRIEGVSIERYGESRHFDEMRMLSYTLRHVKGTEPIPAGSLKVHVTFYERNQGEVEKAKVESADTFQDIAEGLRDGGSVTLTAPYAVAKGAGREDRVFHGVLIRVSKGGRVQDVHAQPESLRQFSR